METLDRSRVGSGGGPGIRLHSGIVPDVRPGEYSRAIEARDGDPARFEGSFDERRMQNLLAGVLDHTEGMPFLDLVRKVVGVEEIADSFFVCTSERVEDAVIQSLENVGCVRCEIEEVDIIIYRELLELKRIVARVIVQQKETGAARFGGTGVTLEVV